MRSKNSLDYQAHLSRHSHDVSAGYFTSMTTGQIIPMYKDILQPGESVYYKTRLFARLQDVVTAFRGEIDLHVDYFFVPLQMLYTPFGQIFAQTNDVISDNFANKINFDVFPSFADNFYDSSDLPTVNMRYDHSEACGKELIRLLDAMGVNPYVVLNSTVAASSGYNKTSDDFDDIYCESSVVSPWFFLAYQAIYQKFYRNDAFERFRIDSFNIDSKFGQSTFAPKANQLQLRYCQRPSDYFTILRPSPVVNSINILQTNTGDFPAGGGTTGTATLLNKVNDFLGLGGYFYNFTAGGNTTFPNYEENNGGVYFDYARISTNNIRSMFALDKFLRIYGRAGKTYDDQILAHFGVKVPHDVKHDLTHLKSYHAVIMADPIYATSTTLPTESSAAAGAAGSLLGQVGGQCQCSLNTDGEKFTAPVHGVFMAVCYAVTKPRYYHTFDKLNLLTNRLSFPIPEFDELGAQPIFSFEYDPYYLQPEFLVNRCGWQNRYQQFKRKYNRISLGFIDPSLWSDVYSSENNNTNIYAPWVLGRSVFDVRRMPTLPTVTGLSFFERPDALDTVMAVQFNREWSNDYFKTPWLMFQTDPIVMDFFCDCKKVSWMSETGEPSL